MTIFNVFSLLGGLALFLFGMDIMGKALEKQAGGQLQKILSKLTDNPLKGFFLGLCVTAVIQSSSATTVMVVGFVNSGIRKLSPCRPERLRIQLVTVGPTLRPMITPMA